MNFKVLGLLVAVMGLFLLIAFEGQKGQAQSDLASNSMEDFYAATSGRLDRAAAAERKRQLEETIERAELFTIVAYIALGLGFAIGIAAYTSSSKTGSTRPGSS